MKKVISIFLFISITAALSAQNVGINSTGALPNSSAMLDVSSTDMGILIPRMTEVQRDAIVSPATSLLIFQTDNTSGYYYNSGTAAVPVWERLTVGSELSFVDGTGAATRVAFWSDANTLGSNANFYWDDTNSRLGIGNAVPTYNLDVTGSARLTGDIIISGSDVYDNSGDLHLSGEDNVYIKMDYNNNDADTRAIIFGKNTNLGAVPTAGNELMRLTETGNLGIGGSPVATAILDLNSTSKGMLVPRMTEAQKNAIATPATGLLIYQIDATTGFYYFDGTLWNWLFSGTVPSVPGNVEHWIRPAAANYIHPEHNSNIRVHDAAEIHGIYYDGSTNQYGIYSQTSSATSPTSAIVGFSNVSGNSTYGYLGYNGTYTAPTAGFGSVYGSGVYGIVDDPGRTAGFFRSTGNAEYAANIAYSDVWIPGFFYGDHIDDAIASRPSVYATMNTFVDVSDMQIGVWGRSEYLGGTSANTGYTVAGRFNSIGNEQDSYGIYVESSSVALSIGAYIEGVDYGIETFGEQYGLRSFSDDIGVYANGTNNGILAYGDLFGVEAYSNDIGVYGNGYNGVVGETTDLVNGWGVFAVGDLGASGAKYFVIDHPKDPENKLLKHACIESDEILNHYRGNVILDENGTATVKLPDYFDAININFSYHLTAVGASAPNLYVSKEIVNNTFEIAGGVPGLKVSWTVEAERNDMYLQKNPEKRNMEIVKDETQKGKFIDPKTWNSSEPSMFSNENIKDLQSETRNKTKNVLIEGMSQSNKTKTNR